MKSVPNKNNWQQFCVVPPLTRTESQMWHKLCELIREGGEFARVALTDPTLSTLYGELRAAEGFVSEDWSDVVACADARRRLRRAEIELYLKWVKGERIRSESESSPN